MNKTELKTKIGSIFVENEVGDITATDVSGVLTDILDCTEIGGSQASIQGSSLVAGSLHIYNGSIQHQNNIDIVVGGGTIMQIRSGSVTCRNLNVKDDINVTGSIKADSIYLNYSGSTNGLLSCGKIQLYVDGAGFPINIKSIYYTGVPNGIRINDGSIVYGITGIQNLDKSNYIDFSSGLINLSTGYFTYLDIIGTNSNKNIKISNGVISGVPGKYIDLVNGSIVGITVSGTVPSNLNTDQLSANIGYIGTLSCNTLDADDFDNGINVSASMNMNNNNITGVNRIITNHIKGSVEGDFNSTGIIVENDLHFGEKQTNHIVINDSSIKVWDASIRQSNNVINIDEQGCTTFANSIKIGSTILDESTLIALKNILTQ